MSATWLLACCTSGAKVPEEQHQCADFVWSHTANGGEGGLGVEEGVGKKVGVGRKRRLKKGEGDGLESKRMCVEGEGKDGVIEEEEEEEKLLLQYQNG